MTKEQLTKLFKENVNNKSTEIDPSNELDWFALTIGWAIAMGLSPEESYSFSTYIRYETNLG